MAKRRERMPEKLKELIDAIGIYQPENAAEQTKAIIQLGVDGRCMTCGNKLMSDTMAIVNKAGVVMLYCSGVCMTDMQVMNWLTMEYDDMVQRLQFRSGGGRGDVVDGSTERRKNEQA